MVANTKAKGSRNERKSKKIFEDLGYSVMKAGRSLGTWDLIGISLDDIVLVQCKTNRWPGKKEMQGIRRFPCPKNCRKLVHRWDDGQKIVKVWKILE